MVALAKLMVFSFVGCLMVAVFPMSESGRWIVGAVASFTVAVLLLTLV